MSLKQKPPEQIWNIIKPILLNFYKRDRTFLYYDTIFQLLIAVILSAQTTDEAVNVVTKKLFAQYKTPEMLAKANKTDIERIIYPLGYYKIKTKYIQKTASMVVQECNGIIPVTEEELRRFPGVGRKTAVVVLSNGMGYNIGIPVDTHVIRFVKRFGLSQAKNPDAIEKDLLQIIAKKDWKKAGYAIKEYGRKEGKARHYNKENDPLMVELKKYE